MYRQLLLDCLPFLAGILLSVVALRLLVWISGARLQLAQLRHLHRDDTGAVQSLSFVLTFPFFALFLLFIVQMSQLTIAQMVVEYSAFAAARSAIVWIPAVDLTGGEEANQIGFRQLVDEDDRGAVYEIVPGSPKYRRIHMAAVLALMPICPSRDLPLEDEPQATEPLQRAYQALAPGSWANPRVADRIRNKLSYALASTEVRIQIRHPSDEPPLLQYSALYPEWHYVYRDEFASNEIGWKDQIAVTVTHQFALLPGPGRLLFRATQTRRRPLILSRPITPEGTGVYTYPLTATVRLQNEGQKSVVPYYRQIPF